MLYYIILYNIISIIIMREMILTVIMMMLMIIVLKIKMFMATMLKMILLMIVKIMISLMKLSMAIILKIVSIMILLMILMVTMIILLFLTRSRLRTEESWDLSSESTSSTTTSRHTFLTFQNQLLYCFQEYVDVFMVNQHI